MQEQELQEAQTEKNNEAFSLEETFEKLDGMLERLEDREISLEESFSLYQQGMQLLHKCSEAIDTVEKKIMIMNGDGELDEF